MYAIRVISIIESMQRLAHVATVLTRLTHFLNGSPPTTTTTSLSPRTTRTNGNDAEINVARELARHSEAWSNARKHTTSCGAAAKSSSDLSLHNILHHVLAISASTSSASVHTPSSCSNMDAVMGASTASNLLDMLLRTSIPPSELERRTRQRSTSSSSSSSPSIDVEVVEKVLMNLYAEAMGLPPRWRWMLSSPSAATTAPSAARQWFWSPMNLREDGNMELMNTNTAPTIAGTSDNPNAIYAHYPRPAAVARTSSSSATTLTKTEDRTSSSSCGGGWIYNSRTEAYACLLHTVLTQARHRWSNTRMHNSADDVVRQQQLLVMYVSDQADPDLARVARLMGVAHIRVLQTIANVKTRNYAVMFSELRRAMAEDISAGRVPALMVGTCGSYLSGAVDPLGEMSDFCARTGVWMHIDACAGGFALSSVMPTTTTTTTSSSASSLLGEDATRDVQVALRKADSFFVCPASCASMADVLVPPNVMDAYNTSPQLLFVADHRKVTWAMRSLDDARSTSMNGRCLGGGAHAARVESVSSASSSLTGNPRQLLHLASYFILQQQQHAVSGTPSSSPRSRLMARQTQHHQHLELISARVMADGRFDCPMVGTTAFGVVMLRWLMQSDEANVELCETWKTIVEDQPHIHDDASSPSSSSTTTTQTPPVDISLSLVYLQRRSWIALRTSTPISKTSPSLVADYVMQTLMEAAHSSLRIE